MRWGLDSSFFLEVKWHFRRSFLSSGGDLHHRGGKYDKKKMRLFILHGGERHHPIIKSMEERDIYMMSSSFLFQWFVVQMASLEVDHESAELTRLSYHFYRSHSVEFLFCVVFLFFISHRLVESNNISSAFFFISSHRAPHHNWRKIEIASVTTTWNTQQHTTSHYYPRIIITGKRFLHSSYCWIFGVICSQVLFLLLYAHHTTQSSSFFWMTTKKIDDI